ncbi:hypothetical protein TSOC_003930 [Tetrabaena socialis]|uniref:Uncharacterized protein n=1 Tax=Tetrabaena socialis TaxID=47790 RepID=A0A2J8AAA6_9CHLO|nr:hypothetical protein TSOC_003930 [Tetrabaena socialis]|eukprot:PNH09447.1 hypothetical protein TSOC_003930 [Tetrabaena socialis]
MHVVFECPYYERLHDKFESAPKFRERDLCTIMAEGPPSASACSLPKAWDTRLKILRHTSAKEGQEDARPPLAPA